MVPINDLIVINPLDNVAVAPLPLVHGTPCRAGDLTVDLQDDIPAAHKVALADILPGSSVVKYGEVIGYAAKSILKGQHVHLHNLKTSLDGLREYTWTGNPNNWPHLAEDCRFLGFRRPDGSVGTRNEIWIIPTVGCVNNTAIRLAEDARTRFGHLLDGIFPMIHNSGCSQLGEDLLVTQRLLRGLINHPNAGGVLVLGLGCENNNVDVFKPFLGKVNPDRVRFLTTQDVDDEQAAGLDLIGRLVDHALTFSREPVTADHLTIGFKCGSSDAFSGITANPLCGRISDHLVSLGGKTILTEVPEMFGAETILMARAASEGVFNQIVSLINGFKQYYMRHDQPIYENPAPGNLKRGITTLEEKSLGCILKGGRSPVAGVIDYGVQPAEPGLHLLNGPGNDPISVTNMIASGAQIILFTTGGGNPYGGPVPTLKISSNTALRALKPHWIDFDAGKILAGQSFDTAEADLFALILKTASGERAKNEINGYREISIFRDGVIL